jgi:DNA (cytosine-5)-methyltransferase 1
MKIKGLSLFSNVGIAELMLKDIGIEVVLANEILPERCRFYKDIFPNAEIVKGDIRDPIILKSIIKKAKDLQVDFIITTPPCQGMSMAGKKDKNDERNLLITYAIEIIQKICPKYIFLENIPQQLKTYIRADKKKLLIPDFLKFKLKKKYNFNKNSIVNASNYSVPQNRIRSIFLLTRKDLPVIWETPPKEKKIINLFDSIGHLPTLDPLIYDIPYSSHLKIFPEYEKKLSKAKKISKWHSPPKHIYRQVLAMMNTPTGKSAFENDKEFKPKTKQGTIVKGFKNTYKRQHWSKPAYTVTTYNRTIGSQENVHPGRKYKYNGITMYSDARVLTVYEIMKVMSIPENWKIPNWCSESFLRTVIGEGIPPLLVKKFFVQLLKIYKKNERKS